MAVFMFYIGVFCIIAAVIVGISDLIELITRWLEQ